MKYINVVSTDFSCRVRDEDAEFLRKEILARFDDILANGRIVKDVRVKRTIEYTINGRTFFIKIYKIGTFWDRIKHIFKGARGLRELENALAVQRRGIDALLPFAAGVGRGFSFTIIERQVGWDVLDAIINPVRNFPNCKPFSEFTTKTPVNGISNGVKDGSLSPATRNKIIYNYGRFARRVHDAGILQYDFNPTNVLASSSDVAFKLADFERVKFYDALSQGQMLKCLSKVNRVDYATRSQRLRFLKGYLSANSSDEKWDIRLVVDKILALGRRQFHRDSTRLTRNCTSENRNFGRFSLGDWSGYYRKRRLDVVREGLTVAEIEVLLTNGEYERQGFTLVDCSDVVGEWRSANVKVRSGGRIPYAAVVGKRAGGTSVGNGFIIFKAP